MLLIPYNGCNQLICHLHNEETCENNVWVGMVWYGSFCQFSYVWHRIDDLFIFLHLANKSCEYKDDCAWRGSPFPSSTACDKVVHRVLCLELKSFCQIETQMQKCLSSLFSLGLYNDLSLTMSTIQHWYTNKSIQCDRNIC